MKTLNIVQGTPEWHAHRAAHFNASDAPAMLGISPYKTRAELVAERATGLAPEIDAATQTRFDEGHRAEALARPLAEKIIGDELYPCVGEAPTPNEKLSASFDGLTLLGDSAFEHKSLNDGLRAIALGTSIDMDKLPDHYRAQMEQQCIVSGASRVLFMASAWHSDDLVEEVHGWYVPDAAMRDRILVGWQQFERDVAEYRPEPTAPVAAVGRAPESLPTLRVEAQGIVTFSNLSEFRASAMQVLGAINRDLKTDEDFANAETTVKWCSGVEDRLDAAKANVLAQMQSVDEACRTIDAVKAETRAVRLELDRLVKSEKEHRRAEIVQHYIGQVRAHYASINATLGEHALQVPVLSSIGAAIKGRKTLSSITDAADAACAAAKIEASQQAERVRQNIAVLAEFADHAHLFADCRELAASKAPEDLRNLATARIAEHAKREAERLEAGRARIREEEQARAARELHRQERERNERIERELRAARQLDTSEGDDASAAASPIPVMAGAAPMPADAPPICLRDINAAIAPLSISAAGLAQLGFHPIESGGTAKLYNAGDFERIREALVTTIQRATLQREKAA